MSSNECVRVKVRVHAWMCKCVLVSVWLCECVCKCVQECASMCLTERVCASVWVRAWMCECVRERARESSREFNYDALLRIKKIIFKWKWIPGEVRKMNFQNKYGENQLSRSRGSGKRKSLIRVFVPKKKKEEKKFGEKLSEWDFRQRGAGSKTLTQINLTLFKVFDSRCLCKNLHLAWLGATCSESQISCSLTWLKFSLSLSLTNTLLSSLYILPSSQFSPLKSFFPRYFTYRQSVLLSVSIRTCSDLFFSQLTFLVVLLQGWVYQGIFKHHEDDAYTSKNLGVCDWLQY